MHITPFSLARNRRTFFPRAQEYVRRFGIVSGPSLFLKLVLRNTLTQRCKRLTVSIPGLRFPITLRARTSDIITFEQSLVFQDYNVPFSHEVNAVIDAGANIGCTSVFFATKFPDARVIAIEPDDRNFEILSLNLAPYSNVTLLHAAVWDRQTTVAIANPDDEFWAYRVVECSPADATKTIQTVTMEDLIAACPSRKADIVKLDVEGAESRIMSDPTRWLSRVRTVLLELHDQIVPGCSLKVQRLLAQGAFVATPRPGHIMLTNSGGLR